MPNTYEAQYKTGDGRVIFKVSAGSQKELFAEIADLQGIFEAETFCRLCDTPKPVFAVRPTDKGAYYELRCTNPVCGARFDFGQHREGGTLFPKRKDDQGNILPNGGWYIYTPDGGRQSAPPQQRQSAPRNAGPPPRDPNSW